MTPARVEELVALLVGLADRAPDDLVPMSRSNLAGISEVISHLRRRVEVREAELAQARARVDHAVRILTGIHSLLYPPIMTLADGRAVAFRPKPEALDPHEVLQELSDRIRAVPDQLKEITAAPADDPIQRDPPGRG